MDFTRQYEHCLDAICRNLMRLVGEQLEVFSDALAIWINDALARRLPANWRDRLAAHLAEWRAQGYEIPAEHLYILEDWIEAWAYVRRRLPVTADGTEIPPRAGNVYLADAVIHKPDGINPAPPRAKSAHRPWADTHGLSPSPLKQQAADASPSPSKSAPNRPAPPHDWPKLTPEERERNQRSLGIPWWYPLKPIGPLDHLWELRLEEPARSARERLQAFFAQLAMLGRMAKKMAGAAEEKDVPDLEMQRDKVQQAYDAYLKERIQIERIWNAYLSTVNVFMGVDLVALKQKIDRSLPTGVQGIASPLDSQLKTVIDDGNRAYEAARGKVERTYTALVWSDRVIKLVELMTLVGTIRAGFRIAVEKAVAEGASLSVAYSRALASAAAEVVVAVGSATLVGAIVPEILGSVGLDEADIAAGLAVFAAISGLLGMRAIKGQTPMHKALPETGPSQPSPSPPSRPSGTITPPKEIRKLPKPPVKKAGPEPEAKLPLYVEPPKKGRGVWDLPPVPRGEEIHRRLGENLPKGFPVVDKFDKGSGIITSIKSLDHQAESYASPEALARVVRGYIDKVAEFRGGRRAEFKIRADQIYGRVLELAVPSNPTTVQREALRDVVEYGRTRGVTVKVVEIKR